MNPLFRKALRAAESARQLLADEDYDGACDRAYYAMFNSARALLEAEGSLAPKDVKTHSSILRMFSEVFVLSNVAARELGRGFNLVQSLRAKADYSRIAVSKDAAIQAVQTMDNMLEFPKGRLETTNGGDT
jgi:uncharacterized protein (UPF0332 family)